MALRLDDVGTDSLLLHVVLVWHAWWEALSLLCMLILLLNSSINHLKWHLLKVLNTLIKGTHLMLLSLMHLRFALISLMG